MAMDDEGDNFGLQVKTNTHVTPTPLKRSSIGHEYDVGQEIQHRSWSAVIGGPHRERGDGECL